MQDNRGRSRQDGYIEFGSFRLHPVLRLLEKNGKPIDVGSRAIEILTLLVESAGDVVSKEELIAHAWPNLIVEESNLRFQISQLRRILDDGNNGARFIKTIPSRGYCFVHSLLKQTPKEALDAQLDLPHLLQRMIGRDNTVDLIVDQLAISSFVTIVGHGGIGKTTVAVAVAHKLIDTFHGDVCFVDLGRIKEPSFIASALAASLGMVAQQNDPIQNLIAVLQDRQLLLVLDCCEHLIESIAPIAESIIRKAPNLSLLTTSREPLLVENEHVFELSALDLPANDVDAAKIFRCSSTLLFIERAGASGYRREFTDMDAPALARICLKLEGIPLAIELAAGRACTIA